jgi:hypothetical protein
MLVLLRPELVQLDRSKVVVLYVAILVPILPSKGYIANADALETYLTFVCFHCDYLLFRYVYFEKM